MADTPHGRPMRMLVLCGLVLAGCATTQGGDLGIDPYAVQIAEPGEATCTATSASDNAAGAAATNRARSSAGLPAVTARPVLAQVAAAHACDMARRGRMTHIGSTTTGPAARVRAAGYAPSVTAENIAAGPYALPRVLQEWNASQGHRTNILLPQVRDFGIGRAVGADGRTVYWSAVYAAPRQGPVRR
ncbi:CAP domain-containing protein [Paracoccus rhizosphaerae]|uniref:CAP domain-containing protein n=1 Tax=Paracoccus rhizosphaerae TaxID=1133347 RepID=A0ABV6CFL2_9RHOB|nr:CAP domain-containing protein [Paracoccus rhizosphaerae]